MEKKLTRTITSSSAGKSVGAYLKDEMSLTRAQIRSLKFRENGICLNGKRVRVTQILHAQDVLELQLEDTKADSSHLIPVDYPLQILYEDEDVIAVWKPAGMVVHPAHGHYEDSVANHLNDYFRKKKETVQIRCIGRLDRDTCGVLIFAKNKIAAARLWEQRKDGRFQKEYLALCEGEFPDVAYEQWQKIDKPLDRVPQEKNKMSVAAKGKEAVTYYRAVRDDKDALQAAKEIFPDAFGWGENAKSTLVRLRLKTGRTHQIRVHMSYIGHPLVGDPIYGEEVQGEHAHLCAWKAEFIQPFTGKKVLTCHIHLC